ncbi:MAG: Lnb N-terminal periplasmic domain-containing protein [Myxococcota bacterium]
MIRALLATIRFALLPLAVGLAVFWAGAALWFDGAALPTASFAIAAVAVVAAIRPFHRALLVLIALVAVVLSWWLSLPPSNDRDWQPDLAHPAVATIDGDQLTVRNVRNFHYRSETDYDAHWEERTYDLSKLQGADFFMSYWGSPWIAHTIVSWDFGDGEHLAISIETRKEEGEAYSAILGFFRQFELYYVVADERDVIGLRTNQRGEDVYLYRLNAEPELVRAVLLDYLEEINRLAEQPEWYNAATHNCTTTIDHHVQHVAKGTRPWDWRILLNGSLDQMGYENGTVMTGGLPFETLRARGAVSERAREAEVGPDYSARIRSGLPNAGGSP